MTYGIQVVGSHGFTQIDENYKNFVFKAKGSVTLSTLGAGGSVARYEGSITIASNGFPIVAFKSSSVVGIIGTTVSGSNWTFSFASNTNGAVVDWYQFDSPDVGASLSNWGLEILNAAGERVFHSDLKPMRLVDVRNAGAGNATYTSGRTYAACQTADGFQWTETAPAGKGSGQYRAWAAGQSWSGVTLSTPWSFVGAVQIDNIAIGTTTQSYVPPTPQFLVIDVTGY